jgi:hypothetical protein
MPAKSKKSAPIRSIAALKAEKRRLSAEIEQSNEQLDDLVTGIPGRILGSTMGMVAGAVVKGFQNHWQNKEEKRTEAPPADTMETEPESFGQTLQSVGEETAYFALAKLVEKLMARQ